MLPDGEPACAQRLSADDDRAWQAHVRPADWRNPPAGHYALVILGGGPAGLAAARTARARGLRVALVERDRLGGVSLNTGSVPSKALVRTARFYAGMRDAEAVGGKRPGDIVEDFPAVMERLRALRARIAGYHSVERLRAAGIDVFFGAARFTGRDSVAVAGATLRFDRALIATGARPHVPDIPGLTAAGCLTSETIFELTEAPKHLLVIGGGPLGCELAQAFRRLGSCVTIVQNEPKFLPREERDAAQLLSESMARDGVEIRLNTIVTAVTPGAAGDKRVDLVSADNTCSLTVDHILAGVGRAPTVEGLDLDAAGVAHELGRGIRVDDFLRTGNRRVYAAGDCCLEHKFTHTAEASARLAVENAFAFPRRRMSRLTIPWCTYTDPEIAHVGFYVADARDQGIPVRSFVVLMQDVDRAMIDGEECGFVKIHVQDGTDRILGATIVAAHAGEMINEISLAIDARIGLRALSRVPHAYPTQANAIRRAALACVDAASARRSGFFTRLFRR